MLVGDAFIPGIHLRKLGFTYGACAVYLLKMVREYKNLKKHDIPDIFIKTRKTACSQHDVAYVDFKDLPRSTVSDKVLRDKAFDDAKKSKI